MSSSLEKTVIFLHLMKTGGRTLTRILKQNYPQDARFHCGQRAGQSLKELSDMPEEQRRSLQFIYGHLQFGVHRLLPHPCTYITMLRHPVERVMSHYYYALHNPKHFTHQLVTEHNMSLSEYVEHGISDLNNGQVRAIAGDVSQQFQFGDSREDLLHEAQANLDTFFSVVGITEQFDESLLLLKHQLTLTRFLYTRANVNASRRTHTTVSDDDIECIKHYNALDLQLYDAAKQQLQKQIECAGSSFQSELALLKELNAQYEDAQSDLDTIKHQLSKLRRKLRRARRKRNQMKISLKHQEAELSALMNCRSGKLWQAWIKLKQKLPKT
ncbi:MAG: sulfotransferase family 2 domain-containing protein [Leptolyngbyaceae bacterium]|nr:sulfotransferase family 2 domain-containing protein [Leptolyngbyaceae bacterium]